MDPQIVYDLFNTEPEYQICWFWMLLGKIAAGAAKVGSAAIAGAKAAATTVAKGAAEAGATAAPAAATAAPAAATAAPAAATAATAAPAAATAAPAAAAPAAAATTSLETFVNVASKPAATTPAAAAPTATSAPLAATPTVSPVMGSGSPVAGTASPTTFPAGTLSGSPTPAPTSAGLMERVNSFLQEVQAPIKKTDTDIVKLAKNVRDLSQKGDPPQKARTDPGSLQAEQAIDPGAPSRIPELQRAETISSPIGLQLAGRGKDDEPPLSLEQLKGLQQSGVNELVAELRLQRRLFG